MVSQKPSTKSGPHPVDIHVGGRIREIRLGRGLSQEELGEGVEVSYQQIQKYEWGTNRVSASMLYKIASVLGTSVQALFEGYEPASGLTSEP